MALAGSLLPPQVVPSLFAAAERAGQEKPSAEAAPLRDPWADSFAVAAETEREAIVYRAHTILLLRRYFHTSIELGRLPSLVGREYFRSRCSVFHVHTFEDMVIFAHDVERCLATLDDFDQQLIARIILQDYTQDETAELMHCTRRWVVECLPRALDRLTTLLLERQLISRSMRVRPETCQEAENVIFAASNSE